MNSSTNFSSGLIDYDSKCENNLDISPLHPFIYHFHIDFTILCPTPPSLPPLPPPQKKEKTRQEICITIVFHFSWTTTREKLKTMVIFFWGGGEINKVHFGLCENGEQTFLPSLTFVLTVAF